MPITFRSGLIQAPSFSLTDWPSEANRPVTSGTTLSWIGPVGGGVSTANDIRQTSTLTPSGSVSSTANNQVFQDLLISGPITITHTGCTIKRCAIKIPGPGIPSYAVEALNSTNLLLEDCEIDGGNSCGISVATGTGMIVRRCSIHNSVDGFNQDGSNLSVYDSWIHDEWHQTGGHIDPFTNDGTFDNCLLQHNHFHVNDPTDTTGCVTFDTSFGSINGVQVINNLMRGGTRILWLFQNGTFTVTNVSILNNFFDLTTAGAGGYFTNSGGVVATISGNKDYNSGVNIDALLV